MNLPRIVNAWYKRTSSLPSPWRIHFDVTVYVKRIAGEITVQHICARVSIMQN